MPSRVLVVDDEPGYREKLAELLVREGYEVETAGNGHEAIEFGSHYRPDILVTDWMLKNHIHGLHVAESLRTVRPETRTVLITGFASPDLRAEAESSANLVYLEKPFSSEDLLRAIREEEPAASSTENLIAVAEVDDEGRVTYANPRARELFALTDAGAEATHLKEIFGDAAKRVIGSTPGWVEVNPAGPRPLRWRARSKKLPRGGWLLLLLCELQMPFSHHHAVVHMLLDVSEPIRTRWPYAGRILVVDDQELVRRLVITVFDRLGCTCHAAASYDEALQRLEQDAGIELVILDYGLPGDLPEFVNRVRRSHPKLRIVGNSESDRRSEFADAGVHLFLAKPWRSEELINLVTGRLGGCQVCGLYLPLRKARSGESAEPWECTGCGMNYKAILEEEFPEEVRRRVRRPDAKAG